MILSFGFWVSHVQGLVFLRLAVSDSYVYGFFFPTFGGLKFLRLGVSDFYDWGLVFIC